MRGMEPSITPSWIASATLPVCGPSLDVDNFCLGDQPLPALRTPSRRVPRPAEERRKEVAEIRKQLDRIEKNCDFA